MKNAIMGVALLLFVTLPVRSAPPADAATFTLRIMDRSEYRYTCTVVTETRLRREVTTIVDNSPAEIAVFEDAASDTDLSRAHALATDPAFQAAAGVPRSLHTADGYLLPQPGDIIAKGRDNRFITVIVDEGGKPRILSAIVSPQGRAPTYVKGFISFANEVKKRKMNKVLGKVDLMCVIPLPSALTVKTTGK